jgi:general bacterial porin, GBP family
MPSRSCSTPALTLAVAGLSLSPAASQAQAFQVFGYGDLALTVQSDRPATGNTPGTLAMVSSGAWQASRLGLRGKVPLAGDVSGVYDAQTTLNLNSGTLLSGGSINNSGSSPSFNAFRFFDRNAFAGVSSKAYGTLTLGRQATPVTEALWVTDPLKANAGAINMNVRFAYLAGPGATIQAKFGANPTNSVNALDRQDNAVKYVYGNSGFTGMAMYSFGGVVGDRSKGSSVGGLLGYDNDLLSLRGAAVQFKDASAVALNAWTAGGVLKLGPAKLKATYSGNAIEDSSTYGDLKTTIWSTGVTYSVVPDLEVTVAYYGAKRTLARTPLQEANKLYVVPEWYLSKSFMLYGIADYELFNTTGALLDTGTSLVSGAKRSVYVAVGISYFFSS